MQSSVAAHDKKGFRGVCLMDIETLVQKIIPFDTLEQDHINETLLWIRSGASLYRIEKPDVPFKHLVSYFVVLDEKSKKVLLVDHKKSGLWLPPGGHVEFNESPKKTVKRECLEELGIKAEFWSPMPLLLTSTMTVGSTAGHVDVSLWYVVKGIFGQTFCFDQNEFQGIKWYAFHDIPFEKSDPHMRRFIQKLENMI